MAVSVWRISSRLRALQRDQRVTVARVHHRDVRHRLLGASRDPGDVLVDVAGVDDQQIVRRPEAVDQQVVDEGAFGRGQGGVLNLPDLQPGGVVRRDVLHRFEGALAGYLDLAHVGDVEQPGRGAHRHVFGSDAGVLHGHVPAAERHHPGAKGDMRSVERGLLERGRSRIVHVVSGGPARICRETPHGDYAAPGESRFRTAGGSARAGRGPASRCPGWKRRYAFNV